MALLLNIDTSTENASVCISENEQSLGLVQNAEQREHASFIHTAIKQLMAQVNRKLSELDAIAVTNGPGSYTGLRVGLATAKGLCYALNKPLITVNTLKVMTVAAAQFCNDQQLTVDLYCPMIDARRMEVFTALYNKNFDDVLPACSMILEGNSFDTWVTNETILFFGNGSDKFKSLIKAPNALVKVVSFNASHLAPLANKELSKKNFDDVAYAQPAYLKEFYTPVSVMKY